MAAMSVSNDPSTFPSLNGGSSAGGVRLNRSTPPTSTRNSAASTARGSGQAASNAVTPPSFARNDSASTSRRSGQAASTAGSASTAGGGFNFNKYGGGSGKGKAKDTGGAWAKPPAVSVDVVEF